MRYLAICANFAKIGIHSPQDKDMVNVMDSVRRVEAAINHLKEVQPDWNSYEAERVELTSREHAKTFVAKAAHELGPAFWSPKVGATADGGVALIWRKPGLPTKAEVLFSPSGDRFIVFQRRHVLAKGPITHQTRPDFLKLVLA
jgi:hypothetical protein